jgi:hypothetical protein
MNAPRTPARDALSKDAAPRLRRAARWIAAGVTLGLGLLMPHDAAACWECGASADCPRGFLCQELTSSFMACMPAGCQTDSDCAVGMRCVTGTATRCSSSGCTQVNSCAPVWQAGCNGSADCGAGFRCVNSGETCGPSGCTPIAQCQTSEELSCQADSDCPSCWSCTSDPGLACVNPGGPNIPVDAGAPTSDAGSPAKTCRPPYWGLSIGYAGPGPAVDSGVPAGGCPGPRPPGTTPPGSTPTSDAGSGTAPPGKPAASAGCAIGRSPGGGETIGLARDAGSWAWMAALAGGALWSVSRRRRHHPRRSSPRS